MKVFALLATVFAAPTAVQAPGDGVCFPAFIGLMKECTDIQVSDCIITNFTDCIITRQITQCARRRTPALILSHARF